VSLGLKDKNPNIQIGIADPGGSKLYSYYQDGVLETKGGSITEGIGQGRITANLEGIIVDRAYRIEDADALEILYGLTENEGMCLGGSSGINIAGAIALARDMTKDMGPGQTIVTMLCDYGSRYQSKLYNPAFLREKNLPIPPWMTS